MPLCTSLISSCLTTAFCRSAGAGPLLVRPFASLSKSEILGLIKDLRSQTGAPLGDVRSALEETGYDLDAAFDALRKRGAAAAAKKADRTASQVRRPQRYRLENLVFANACSLENLLNAVARPAVYCHCTKRPPRSAGALIMACHSPIGLISKGISCIVPQSMPCPRCACFCLRLSSTPRVLPAAIPETGQGCYRFCHVVRYM